MKGKHVEAFMATAKTFASCSTATKLQVGAIVVKDDRIISIGYNGMPSGWDNDCEDKQYPHPDIKLTKEEKEKLFPYTDEENNVYDLRTKKEVLHAEANAITKLARSNESGENASIFITHAPCIECAKLIYQSGIQTVYYENEYRLEEGIEFLIKSGIHVYKLTED
jgi:dCMP deaminase